MAFVLNRIILTHKYQFEFIGAWHILCNCQWLDG